MRRGLAAAVAVASVTASVAYALPALQQEPAGAARASSPLRAAPRAHPSPRDASAVVGRDNREPRPTIAPSPPSTSVPPPPPERASGPSSDREPARESGKPAASPGAAQKTAAPEPAPPPPPPKPEPTPPGPGPQTEEAFKAWAQARVPADQWPCLDALWESESGWSHTADNPTSSAYGIPQALTDTHGLNGTDYMTDGYVQMEWGLAYIRDRYGTPCAAWSFKQANGWY